MKEQALTYLDERLPVIPADRSLMMARPAEQVESFYIVPEAMEEQALTCLNERLPAVPADRGLMKSRPGGAG